MLIHCLQIGYAQGFNFLAVVLLNVHGGDDELAFWNFCALVEFHFPPDFFAVEPNMMLGFHVVHILRA
jgi:hypothetical protein